MSQAVNQTPLEILEQKVTLFLQSFAKNDYAKDKIAPLVAQKSLQPNHLYEDLGFQNRTQMGKFMKEHFPALASQKPCDKLWKKYIYDSIGEVAPSCATCSDQINCFVCKV
ncbi:MAG: nitrogen fixation protein NifQ [Campylobacterales bacterium]|nr:nitrogen fixation protein NifQ [Campylobacterales bacterium]